jgi:hypothetical protein
MRELKWAAVLISIAAVILYMPGVSATFLLDDFHILQPMAFSGGIRDAQSLFAYLDSGGGGPLGRPVSLITFALNAQNWPADPKPFLITNIFIHSVNSLLVYFFVLALGGAIAKSNDDRVSWLALFCCMIWALHPFHTSSVLYIVQRMTTLSTTFGLITFTAFLGFRSAVIGGHNCRAMLLLLSMAIFSILAVLTKESALLIPVFLLLIEWVLRWGGASSSRRIDHLYHFLLIPSAIVIVAYPLKLVFSDLFIFLTSGEVPLHGRTFSMWERFLTQGRVLLDYLQGIVLPKMQSAGVFHDQYKISTGLVSPLPTLFAWCVHVMAIAAAFRWRKHAPLVSFGILWFYAGHLLESTVIMLELKFEHRNYLPSLGLVIAFVSAVDRIAVSLRAKMLVLGGVSMLLSLLLFFCASLWGRPYQAALVWAHENPQSARALEEAARRSIVYAEDIPAAQHYLKQMIKVAPYAANELKYILAFCETYDGEEPDWAGYAKRIQSDPRDWSLVKVINDLLKSRIKGNCHMPSYESLQLLVDGFRKNKVYWGDPSSNLNDKTEYEAAAFFRDEEKIRAMEYDIDLQNVHLWQTTIRAGILATHGHLDLASERLSQAIELNKRNSVHPESRELIDAIEVLNLIESERSVQ